MRLKIANRYNDGFYVQFLNEYYLPIYFLASRLKIETDVLISIVFDALYVDNSCEQYVGIEGFGEGEMEGFIFSIIKDSQYAGKLSEDNETYIFSFCLDVAMHRGFFYKSFEFFLAKGKDILTFKLVDLYGKQLLYEPSLYDLSYATKDFVLFLFHNTDAIELGMGRMNGELAKSYYRKYSKTN